MASKNEKVVNKIEKQVMSELTLVTIVNVLGGYLNFGEANLNELISYSECELTKEVAEDGLYWLQNIFAALEKLNLPEENKKNFSNIMTQIVTLKTSMDSKDLLIDFITNALCESNAEKEKLKIDYQEERNQHNIALKKLNEELKPSIIKNIDITFTPKKCGGKIIPIQSKDVKMLFNSVVGGDISKLSWDRKTRVSVPKDCRNTISNAQAKLNLK